jgi:hypothetical protein
MNGRGGRMGKGGSVDSVLELPIIYVNCCSARDKIRLFTTIFY